MPESWEMFDQIAPTYDRLNRILSMGMDQGWRRRLAKEVAGVAAAPSNKGLRLLDCATGTGDQLLACLSQVTQIEEAVGIDLAEAMLAVARQKASTHPKGARVRFDLASAAALPFEVGSFSCVTMSFGIRNVGNVSCALAEAFRVLAAPGGKLLILEFSIPTHKLIRLPYLLYLRHLLPRLGGLLSGHKIAYRYLNETIEKFPYGEAFCSLMRDVGFKDVRALPLTFGIATLYSGEKR